MILSLMVFTSIAFGALTEMEKIDALISAVEKSDVVFIRNGQEHSNVDAAKHLRDKLNTAIRSPFAPKKSDWTAMMFIDRIGSKSSSSGKEYYIKLPDGSQTKAKDWLIARLKQIEAANP